MPVIIISSDLITNWESFHDVFKTTLGFPDYYGRNMDAWIDCLTYADDPDTGDLADHVYARDGDVLTLQIDSVASLRERCPDQYDALIECSSFVNWRRIEAGERPVLALSFYE